MELVKLDKAVKLPVVSCSVPYTPPNCLIEIDETVRLPVAPYSWAVWIHENIRNAKGDIEILFNIDEGKVISQNLLFILSTLPFVGDKYNKKVIIRCNPRGFVM